VSPTPPSANGKVKKWEEKVQKIGPNDSYQTISQTYYSSEAYAEALQAFNAEHESRKGDGVLRLGELVFIPEISELENRYPDRIRQATKPAAAAFPVTRVAPAVIPPTVAPPAALPLVTPPTAVPPVMPAVVTPPAAPTPTAPAAASTPAQYPIYVVRGSNERLYDIAKRLLGDGMRWPELQNLNRSLDAQTPVLVGTKVQLPPGTPVLAGQ
jgi:hypothetical protein